MAKEIVRQLDPIFRPASIAFVGASKDPNKWGHTKLKYTLSGGYSGQIYPVNPREEEVLGHRSYPSLSAIPGPVDLAVITVTAIQVPKVFEECGAKGIKGAVVASAGFAEVGEEGRRLQDELVRLARKGGFRFVGPNCIGISDGASKLSLTIWDLLPEGISFVTQSASLSDIAMPLVIDQGYSFTKFISMGNQADIDFAEYIEYLGEDKATKAIVLYVEELTEGRRFLEMAREIGQRKPITLFKGGYSAAGARAALSHTGSLAGQDEVFEALCKQAGVLRGRELLHPFEMAQALISQPLPKGNRVAVVSGGGGQCVALADACSSQGLEVPLFDRETQAKLSEILPPYVSSPTNPVDTGLGPVAIPPEVVITLASLSYIDGVVLTSPASAVLLPGKKDAEIPEVVQKSLQAIIEVPRAGKPVVALSPTGGVFGGSRAPQLLREAGIPLYQTPSQCARAMAALVRYAEFRS